MSFGQLVRSLATPKNAVTCAIRRIGLAAAIGCIEGIVWEYI